MSRFIHHGKRVLRITGGIILLIAGIIMTIPLVPGPGLLVIFIALTILAIDFVWAHRAKTWMHGKYSQALNKVRKKPIAPEPEVKP